MWSFRSSTVSTSSIVCGIFRYTPEPFRKIAYYEHDCVFDSDMSIYPGIMTNGQQPAVFKSFMVDITFCSSLAAKVPSNSPNSLGLNLGRLLQSHVYTKYSVNQTCIYTFDSIK